MIRISRLQRIPIEAAAKARGQERYDEILAEAQEKIDSGQAELDSGRQKLEQQKASTYGKLRESKSTLDSKSSEISSGKQQLKTKRSELTAQQTQLTGQIKLLQESITGGRIAGIRCSAGADRTDEGSASADAGRCCADRKRDYSRSQNRKKSWLREKKRSRADIYSISTAKRRLICSLLRRAGAGRRTEGTG